MYQPFRDFEGVDAERARAQPAPGAPQVRAHGRARRRHAARLLQRRAGRHRRPRALGRPAAPAGRGGRRARHPDRLRGARLGHPRERLPGRLADRRAGRPPQPRHLPGLLPHPLARQRPGRDPRDPRREDLLPPAGRRPGDGDGRAPVEPPLPLLPRPGRVRPRRLHGPRRRPPATAGPWSLEVFNDVFRQADPDRIAVDAMRSLMVLAAAVGERPLPPAPELRGLAFVELAVGSESGAETAGVLEAMGFAHVGPHRSKPVQLWQHGDARVLLNHGDDRTAGRSAGRGAGRRERGSRPAPRSAPRRCSPRCCRAAADPARPTWPRSPRRTRPPSCSAAPTPARTDGSGDFVELEHDQTATPTCTRIDHVVLSQPFDYFDEAALFYRSVLGLEPHDSQDLAGPDGLLRSRSVERSDRAPAPRAHGAAPGRRRARAARRAAARGVRQPRRRRGRPPDARAGGAAARDPRQLLRRSRGSDASSRTTPSRRCASSASSTTPGPSGEFLHFFTEMVGGRLFFEVVERRGAYDGYGAANSPVRLSAQLYRAAGASPA